MLKKETPQQKEISTTIMQRLLTWGLVLFIIYIYVADFNPKDKVDTKVTSDSELVVLNKISGESKPVRFTSTGKMSLSIKASDLDGLNAKPVSSKDDSIVVFELQIASGEEKESEIPVEAIEKQPTTEKTEESEETNESSEDIIEEFIEESQETDIPEVVEEPVEIEPEAEVKTISDEIKDAAKESPNE